MTTTDETLAAAVSTYEELMFNKFDRLHKAGINDDDVIRFLRTEGHTLLADRYIEWSGALDPDREPNSTLGGAVPDPGNAPSYDALNSSGIRTTGAVGFGGIGFEFGRDGRGRQHLRPVGGVWVPVIEEP